MRKNNKTNDKKNNEELNIESDLNIETGKKKGKKKRHIGLKIFIFILILLGIAGGLFVKRVNDLDGNWLAALFGHNKDTLQNLDKLYVLAMGESTGMSDTMIVCSYDPKTQEASMLSIPRDTFIGDSRNNAKTTDKINSLYNNGRNPEKTLEAVNELTGLNIQNYILIDTEGNPIIIDFGNAKTHIRNSDKKLSIVLKPGFAPPEQYTGKGQGPWTDVYSLAGVFYYIVTGMK